MSDIIYTPPASGGGGGTTINPQNNVIPVRLDATTFVDSNIENDVNNYLKTSVGTTSGNYFGLFIDFGLLISNLGDINSGYETILSVDDGNQIIKTQSRGNDIGLSLEFANNRQFLGDFNFINNGTWLTIDDNIQYVSTTNQGAAKGLRLDFANSLYFFGDFDNVNNGTSFLIDDSTQKMTFNTEFLNFVGASLTDGATVVPVGRNLKVTINGSQYHIPLYN